MENLKSFLLIQLSLLQTIQSIEAKTEQSAEETLGWACLVATHCLLEMPLNSLFAIVVYNEKVAFVQAWVHDSSQDRLVVRQKLLLFRAQLLCLGASSLRVQFLYDLCQS